MATAQSFLAGDAVDELALGVQSKAPAVFARYRIPVQDAEDLLQQALLTYLYKAPTVRDPVPWVIGTLRNLCLLYWRGRRRRVYDAVDRATLELLADAREPEQEGAMLRTEVEGVLQRLPNRCRKILRLRYLEGYKPTEVAREMGYKDSGIYQLTKRCLAAFTKCLIAE